MSSRKYLFFMGACFIHQLASAQSFSSARASIGTEIIEPVGTEQTGKMILASLHPGKEKNSVTFGYRENRVNRPGDTYGQEPLVLPEFRVRSAQQVYALSLEFDPLLYHEGKPEDFIKVEAVKLQALPEPGINTVSSDRYTIDTRLGLGAGQAPGNYTTAKPCRVTVHFN